MSCELTVPTPSYEVVRGNLRHPVRKALDRAIVSTERILKEAPQDAMVQPFLSSYLREVQRKFVELHPGIKFPLLSETLLGQLSILMQYGGKIQIQPNLEWDIPAIYAVIMGSLVYRSLQEALPGKVTTEVVRDPGAQATAAIINKIMWLPYKNTMSAKPLASVVIREEKRLENVNPLGFKLTTPGGTFTCPNGLINPMASRMI